MAPVDGGTSEFVRREPRCCVQDTPSDSRAHSSRELAASERSNLRTASSLALRAFLSHIRELSSITIAPAFGPNAITGNYYTPRLTTIRAEFFWTATAQLQRAVDCAAPCVRIAESQRPLIVAAWTSYTWDEWVCVIEMRRKELQASAIAGIQKAQWQQDGWTFGRGGLDIDGTIMCRTLTVPMIRRLPYAPVMDDYAPTWWDDDTRASKHYVYSDDLPLGALHTIDTIVWLYQPLLFQLQTNISDTRLL